MPRQLALLLCIAFVLYLLRYDRRQASSVSWALWIPSLWVLIIASRPLDSWFDISGVTRESGGLLDPIFQAASLCLGLIILAKRRFSWSTLIREHPWLIILVAYMLASAIWSDVPFHSFRAWFRELVAVVMASLVLSEADPEEAIRSVLRRIAYILIPLSILFVKYYPDRGVVYSRYTGEIQWTGVAQQKNSLGALCLISSFFLVWTFVRRWGGRDDSVHKNQTRAEVVLLLITFWLLNGPSAWAASATSIVALTIGLITLFCFLSIRKRMHLGISTWVIITACVIGLGIASPIIGGFTVKGVTSALGRDATLTGRTDIWAGLLPDVMRQPLLGYGFSGFWSAQRTLEHEIGEAHNGYLDVTLQLGLIGLFLTTMFLLSCARRAYHVSRSNFDLGCLLFCLVLMAGTVSMAESAIDSLTRVMMAVVLLSSVSGTPVVKPGSGFQRQTEYSQSVRTGQNPKSKTARGYFDSAATRVGKTLGHLVNNVGDSDAEVSVGAIET